MLIEGLTVIKATHWNLGKWPMSLNRQALHDTKMCFQTAGWRMLLFKKQPGILQSCLLYCLNVPLLQLNFTLWNSQNIQLCTLLFKGVKFTRFGTQSYACQLRRCCNSCRILGNPSTYMQLLREIRQSGVWDHPYVANLLFYFSFILDLGAYD